MCDYFYRGLRQHEWDQRQLIPKGTRLFELGPHSLIDRVFFKRPYPDARMAEHEHVTRKGNTSGVSTTKDIEIAKKKYSQSGYIAKISREKVRQYGIRERHVGGEDQEVILVPPPGVCRFPSDIIQEFIRVPGVDDGLKTGTSPRRGWPAPRS